MTHTGEFVIRKTQPEELDAYIEILERAATWMESQNLRQWIPGTFRKPDSRLHIQTAIFCGTSYVVHHISPTNPNEPKIAAIFALNYQDPFDEMLWAHATKDWLDAVYVHRLVVEKEFQGKGIVPLILAFTEELIRTEGWSSKDGSSTVASEAEEVTFVKDSFVKTRAILDRREQVEALRRRPKHYLRLDCRANNPGLRKFYREKSLGPGLGGLTELGSYENPATGIAYTRFERLVVPF